MWDESGCCSWRRWRSLRGTSLRSGERTSAANWQVSLCIRKLIALRSTVSIKEPQLRQVEERTASFLSWRLASDCCGRWLYSASSLFDRLHHPDTAGAGIRGRFHPYQYHVFKAYSVETWLKRWSTVEFFTAVLNNRLEKATWAESVFVFPEVSVPPGCNHSAHTVTLISPQWPSEEELWHFYPQHSAPTAFFNKLFFEADCAIDVVSYRSSTIITPVRKI